MKNIVAWALQGSAAAALIVPFEVAAQDQTVSPTSSETALTAEADETAQDGIQDIIVTATRREERLQNVPTSITAISAGSLQGAGIVQPRELGLVVPNLNVVQVGFLTQPVIRGVGTVNQSAGDEPNVSIYIDGIYQPEMSGNNFDLLEIERIEVLRGPQGTIFGRNATGGLINIITPDPSFDTSGNVSASYGRFDSVQLRGYVTTGISDKLAIDIAGLFYDDDGYARNDFQKTRISERSSRAVRSKLLFRPSDRAKLTATLTYNRFQGTAGFAAQALTNNMAANALDPSLLLPTQPNHAALGPDTPLPVGTENRQYGASLRSEFDLGAVRLETATAWNDSDGRQIFDADASPLLLSHSDVTIRSQYYSHEMRLLSQTDGPFSWLAGVYGFWGNLSSFVDIYTPTSVIQARPRSSTEAYAAFAEGNLEFGDGLTLTGGLRYSRETKKFRQIFNGATIPPAQATFDRWTPKVSLSYRPSQEVNLYATYSTGFKSGLFNAFGPSNVPVRPETITSYEIGAKTDLSRFLRANFSVFHYDYKDLQVSARLQVNTLLNAAQAKVDGAEAEITALVADGLSTRFTLAYVDARYKSFPVALVFTPLQGGGNAQASQDVAGNQLVRSPDLTFTLGADYRKDFGVGKLGVSANYFHSSRVYYDFLNRVSQAPYGVLNGEISWTLPNDLQFTAWGKNMTNAHYAQFMNTSVLGDYIVYERPVSYGVRLDYRF